MTDYKDGDATETQEVNPLRSSFSYLVQDLLTLRRNAAKAGKEIFATLKISAANVGLRFAEEQASQQNPQQEMQRQNAEKLAPSDATQLATSIENRRRASSIDNPSVPKISRLHAKTHHNSGNSSRRQTAGGLPRSQGAPEYRGASPPRSVGHNVASGKRASVNPPLPTPNYLKAISPDKSHNHHHHGDAVIAFIESKLQDVGAESLSKNKEEAVSTQSAPPTGAVPRSKSVADLVAREILRPSDIAPVDAPKTMTDAWSNPPTPRARNMMSNFEDGLAMAIEEDKGLRPSEGPMRQTSKLSTPNISHAGSRVVTSTGPKVMLKPVGVTGSSLNVTGVMAVEAAAPKVLLGQSGTPAIQHSSSNRPSVTILNYVTTPGAQKDLNFSPSCIPFKPNLNSRPSSAAAKVIAPAITPLPWSTAPAPTPLPPGLVTTDGPTASYRGVGALRNANRRSLPSQPEPSNSNFVETGLIGKKVANPEQANTYDRTGRGVFSGVGGKVQGPRTLGNLVENGVASPSALRTSYGVRKSEGHDEVAGLSIRSQRNANNDLPEVVVSSDSVKKGPEVTELVAVIDIVEEDGGAIPEEDEFIAEEVEEDLMKEKEKHEPTGASPMAVQVSENYKPTEKYSNFIAELPEEDQDEMNGAPFAMYEVQEEEEEEDVEAEEEGGDGETQVGDEGYQRDPSSVSSAELVPAASPALRVETIEDVDLVLQKYIRFWEVRARTLRKEDVAPAVEPAELSLTSAESMEMTSAESMEMVSAEAMETPEAHEMLDEQINDSSVAVNSMNSSEGNSNMELAEASNATIGSPVVNEQHVDEQYVDEQPLERAENVPGQLETSALVPEVKQSPDVGDQKDLSSAEMEQLIAVVDINKLSGFERNNRLNSGGHKGDDAVGPWSTRDPVDIPIRTVILQPHTEGAFDASKSLIKEPKPLIESCDPDVPLVYQEVEDAERKLQHRPHWKASKGNLVQALFSERQKADGSMEEISPEQFGDYPDFAPHSDTSSDSLENFQGQLVLAHFLDSREPRFKHE
ncbi:hypothetical protein HK101_005259 [Irineochytrium annulatum]|nr:hypothetical protein HK101_005259 [Irineochytrium annulatum]